MTTPNAECLSSRPTYIGGSDPLAFLAKLFGFDYKTAHEEAHECASHLTQTTGRDHYVNLDCHNISDGTPPVVLGCYYKVVSGKRL
jgi:hypothetical protein